MRFASLGSGSEGNALVVQSGATCVLMDCGFTLIETRARLDRLDLPIDRISGIVVTHEHGDHISGVAQLARKYAIPVWLTHGTREAHGEAFDKAPSVTEINPHHAFAIGELQILPYTVPHDAAEPVQYVFSDGERRLGVLTDAGCSTPHMEAALSGMDALMLECNHDAGMLAKSDYPYSLKQRIGGRLGHLSNHAAAELLARLDNSRLQHIVAAHLSQRNNTASLAAQAVSEALNCAADWITVATQIEGFAWLEIS